MANVAKKLPTAAGALITMARQDGHLTQRELAARAGVSQSEVARIETGKREPSIPTLQKILAGAGVELRFHLAPLDDHDQVLERRQVKRGHQEQVDAEDQHRRNVAQFAANVRAR